MHEETSLGEKDKSLSKKELSMKESHRSFSSSRVHMQWEGSRSQGVLSYDNLV